MPSQKLADVQDFNATELLQIINPQTSSLSCVGHAPFKGRRCWNPIAQHNVEHARGILDSLPFIANKKTELLNELEELALATLCRRYHQGQSTEIAQKWYKKVKAEVKRLELELPSQPRVCKIDLGVHNALLAKSDQLQRRVDDLEIDVEAGKNAIQRVIELEEEVEDRNRVVRRVDDLENQLRNSVARISVLRAESRAGEQMIECLVREATIASTISKTGRGETEPDPQPLQALHPNYYELLAAWTDRLAPLADLLAGYCRSAAESRVKTELHEQEMLRSSWNIEQKDRLIDHLHHKWKQERVARKQSDEERQRRERRWQSEQAQEREHHCAGERRFEDQSELLGTIDQPRVQTEEDRQALLETESALRDNKLRWEEHERAELARGEKRPACRRVEKRRGCCGAWSFLSMRGGLYEKLAWSCFSV